MRWKTTFDEDYVKVQQHRIWPMSNCRQQIMTASNELLQKRCARCGQRERSASFGVLSVACG